MFRLAFLIGVVVVLRLEYLLAAVIVKRKARDWSANKVRIFTARVISLTHATLSSVGCICSLSSDSHYVKEPYDYSTYSAQYIFLFSMGYFIYDMIDMYIHGEALYSKEYYIHHSLVLTAFSIILRTGKLFGFAMIGLLVEVQTIFLHLRTMIRLTRYAKKKSRAYNALIYANMVCLFVFRHLTTTYLLYVMLYKDEKCPMLLRAFLVSGLLFLTYHNTHLTIDQECAAHPNKGLVSAKNLFLYPSHAFCKECMIILKISMVKTDGFFGYEMQSVDEDHADPLGPVKVKKS